jgi:hypothetical protein
MTENLITTYYQYLGNDILSESTASDGILYDVSLSGLNVATEKYAKTQAPESSHSIFLTA